MKIGLSSIAYNEGGYTKKQFASILRNTKHDVIPMLYLHNMRSKSLIDECQSVSEEYDLKYYYPYGVNRGICKSTNESLHTGFVIEECDIVVGISQDVWFNTPHAFDDWIEAATQYIDNACIIGNKTCEEDRASFSMSIFTPNFLATIGYTDENFFPAQYDDMDNARRLDMAWQNETPFKIDVISDSTHDSMLSRRADPTLAIQQAYITLPLCQYYYCMKWGGMPGEEKYTHPFNNDSIGYKIDWENRANPYGDVYDRKDQGVVRV